MKCWMKLQTEVKQQIENYPEREKLSSKSVWFNVQSPVQSFIGRKVELQHLHTLSQQITTNTDCKHRNPMFEKLTVICGLGGVGKTQLVAKYIQDFCGDYNYNIIWINAETFGSLCASFIHLADELGTITRIDGRNNIDIKFMVNEVYKYFTSQKSLFIFDNAQQLHTAEGIQGIDEFLPEESIKAVPYIFVICRNQTLDDDIKILTLSKFSKEEAAELIKDQLDIYDDSQYDNVLQLSGSVQYFPLALHQAVSYIKTQTSTLKMVEPQAQFTIEDYLNEFDVDISKVETLLEHRMVLNGSDFFNVQSILKTWYVAIKSIADNKNNINEQALQLLNIVAFYASERIPMTSLLYFFQNDERQLVDCVDLLEQYFLVRLDNGYLFVNRLVQQITRLWLKGKGLEERIITVAFELLQQSYYGGNNLSDLVSHLEHFDIHTTTWLAENATTENNMENLCVLPLLLCISKFYHNISYPEKQI